MALSIRKQYIELNEYFSKYGFGDGDEDEIGWEHRDTAKEILEKHLKPFGITVEYYDASSIHNDCRLEFGHPYEDMSDEANWLDADSWAQYFDNPDSPEAQTKGRAIVKALEVACTEFDMTVSGPDYEEMIKSILENKELCPLLMGIHKELDILIEKKLKGKK